MSIFYQSPNMDSARSVIVDEKGTCSIRRLKPEDELLFVCTRQNFRDAHQRTVLDVCRQHEINWPVVYQIAELHGVAPLIYANLQQCPRSGLGIPPDITERFRQCLMRNMFVKEHLARNLSRALSFLGGKSIDTMLIKGAALDVLVYDQPYYTVSSDVDVVISVRQREITEEQHREFMEFFHQSGIEYDYFEHHDMVMNGVLPVDFQRIWADAVKIQFKGHDIWVMSPEDMLISVCINSCRKRFFRLKALCDIAETIDRYPDLRWPELVSKARAYDCHNIVYTALLVTKMTLGCQLPAEVLDNLNISPVRANIIRALSRRMSLSAFSSLYFGKSLFGRSLDWSLLLPYATFRWYQVWRRVAFVYSTKETG